MLRFKGCFAWCAAAFVVSCGAAPVSKDVTTTSAVVAEPQSQQLACANGQVPAVTEHPMCVAPCDRRGMCRGRPARLCGPGEFLAGAPDSAIDYCVGSPSSGAGGLRP